MKSLKSILDMELIQVDWKNIISINNLIDKKESNEKEEDCGFLFI